MTSAKEIALNAHDQALAAVERERERREVEERERERQRQERLTIIFNRARPTLEAWFPGVEWEWTGDGNFGNDVIVWDASEQWPPSFKLLIKVLHDKVYIKCGDYRPDTSMPGYSYFAGIEVKSPAEIGQYLREKNG